jgi:chromosome segregation ATPase
VKLDDIRKQQERVTQMDYSLYSKERLIFWIHEMESEHRRIETFYRCKIDELDNELSRAKEKILRLIDDKNEYEEELMKLLKERKELKEEIHELDVDKSELQVQIQNIQHDLNLTQREITRQENQLQEDEQKINLLNKQIEGLKDSLKKEKGFNSDALFQLEEYRKEQDRLKVSVENLQDELMQLRYNKECGAIPDLDTTLQAIQQLSLIILSKDKIAFLDPSTRSMIQKVFGENGSKVFEMYEKKLAQLKAEKKEIRDKVRNEITLAMNAMKELNDMYDMIVDISELIEMGELETVIDHLADKRDTIMHRKGRIRKAFQDARSLLNFAAKDSIRDKSDDLSYGKAEEDTTLNSLRSKSRDSSETWTLETREVPPLYPQRPSSRQSTGSARQSYKPSVHDSLREARMQECVSTNMDLIAFLHCSTLAVEELLHENIMAGSYMDDSVLDCS